MVSPINIYNRAAQVIYHTELFDKCNHSTYKLKPKDRIELNQYVKKNSIYDMDIKYVYKKDIEEEVKEAKKRKQYNINVIFSILSIIASFIAFLAFKQ